jgi:hypothetical protein
LPSSKPSNVVSADGEAVSITLLILQKLQRLQKITAVWRKLSQSHVNPPIDALIDRVSMSKQYLASARLIMLMYG